MFHFFAKIGKIPWIKNVLPIVSASTTIGYVGVHFFGHNLIRDLLSAQSSSGKREEISKDLQNLIKLVYDDIKDNFNQPIFENKFFEIPPPIIKWFSSSCLDPITFGMTEAKTGVLIGLPNHYNCEKAEDLPSNALEISKVKLFRSMKGTKNQGDESFNDDENFESSAVTKIIKDTPNGQDYINSIILSEKAKKFSIARELFEGDSYRPIAIAGVILASFLLSISLSRASVQRMGLKDAHLTQRLPFYLISGLAGVYNYYFVSDATNQYYTKKSDIRAISLNESYKEGAMEYFSKLLQRNKAMRNLVDEMKGIYDDEGNIIESYLRRKYLPLTERLAYVQLNAEITEKEA